MVRRYFKEHHGALRVADTWPHEAKRALTRTILHAEPAATPVRDQEFDRSLAAKAILIAHAATLGDPAAVAPHERRWAMGLVDAVGRDGPVPLRLEALRTAFASVPPATRTEVTADVEVVLGEFASRWKPRGASASGILATTPAPFSMRRVEAGHAPVAVRLRCTEGWLDVRRMGGTWLRPVTTPGSWEPIRAGDFLDAVRLGVPWNDDPFAPGPRGRMVAIGAHEHAQAVVPVSATDRSRHEAAARVATDRCGPLLFVDGVVHRVTAEPRVCVARVDESLVPSWYLAGDIHERSCLETIPSAATTTPWGLWHGTHVPDSLALGVAVVDLGRMVDAFASAKAGRDDGAKVTDADDVRSSMTARTLTEAAIGLVDVVDADAFASDPAALLGMAVEVMGRQLRRMLDTGANAWEDAARLRWLQVIVPEMELALRTHAEGDHIGAAERAAGICETSPAARNETQSLLMHMVLRESRDYLEGIGPSEPDLSSFHM